MGCGASKGKEEGNTVEEINFKYMGVYEADEFFRKVKELLDSMKEVTAPLDESKDDFFDTTEFYKVPGASKIFGNFFY